jgi:tRNA(Ile)-lysidine synthase
MNINVVRTLPQNIYIAFSGGVDSVVLLHKALSKNKNVTLAFFHHGNDLAKDEQEFAIETANRLNIPIIIGKCNKELTGSKEKFWRDERYKFFNSLPDTVATGHHLDDVVEWYLLTCLRGEGHYIPYNNKNVIRPLLLTSKNDILEYAIENNLKWFNDVSNTDPEFTYRNKIRLEILPKCLEINPGLYTTISNKIRKILSLKEH